MSFEETVSEEININKFENFRTDVVTKVAFLIGVPFDILDKRNYDKDALEAVNSDKRTLIIRHLSILRWQIFRFYSEIMEKRNDGLSLRGVGDSYLSGESIDYLASNGIDIVNTKKLGKNITINLAFINQFIQDNIGNIKDFFPNWVKFDYIKKLFIMPDCSSGYNARNLADKSSTAEIIENIHRIRKDFLDQRKSYPFGYFLMWPVPFSEEDGNILFNDAKFLELLYKVNGDEFAALDYVIDAPQMYKKRIYDFINQAKSVSVIVDCENANPYSLVAAILNLDDENMSKIKKIVLIDDVNTSLAWDYIQDVCEIPIEHKETERILENKSLVDVVMTVSICKEFYKEGTDSIFLVSSDSDFWGVIMSLKEARFFVLNEKNYTSRTVIDNLDIHGIEHCFMDSFAFDKVQEFKEKMLLNILRSAMNEFEKTHIWPLPLKRDELVDVLFAKAKIRDADERQLEQEKHSFAEKYLKRGFALTPIDVDGEFTYRMDYQKK